LLAFALGLSISYAQNRFEARRDLVQVEANAIGTAWLRANLVDDAEGIAIAGKIEDYARVRLAFTTAISEANVPALVAQTNALQADIWRDTQMIARRAPTPITAETLACSARNPGPAGMPTFGCEDIEGQRSFIRYGGRCCSALFSAALIEALQHDVKGRHEDHCDAGGGEHAAGNRNAN
jgi:hypothetical protein